ncbi:HEPN domain-containing protein [Glycomyces sp. NPDC021274]|uniref:HEPN domain-containing protein n=1 Tax=Glycomyces sp. NPDC021274 TaxID=3155120 RepID=UPI0033DBCE5A
MALTTLPGLDPTEVALESPVYLAQKFLTAAYDSVDSLIATTYPALRGQRTGTRGALTDPEQDLFRAAVVFAGAGVDAVLKEAIRHCVSIRIENSETASEKYLDFIERYLKDGQDLAPRKLAALLVSKTPGEDLQAAYVEYLTGSSLQSKTQVVNVLSALGLDSEKELYKESQSLNALFKARNEIAHEMDLTPSSVRLPRSRKKRSRTLPSYVEMCHAGLNYCQKVLNRLEVHVSSQGALSC